jgi:hypothetical protein
MMQIKEKDRQIGGLKRGGSSNEHPKSVTLRAHYLENAA